MRTYKNKQGSSHTRKNKQNKHSKTQNKKTYGGSTGENYIVIHSSNGNNEDLDELQKNILNKSFNTTDLDEYIRNTILEIRDKIPSTSDKNEWLSCKGECFSAIRKHVDIEINSTAYMLRTLAFSIISFKGNSDSIQIVYTGNDNGINLSGKWEEDKDKFKINVKSNNPNGPGKLIMGLGPSASGKTYWAKTIIKLLHENLENFPDTFLSIDGGIYRESSFVYQSVVYILRKMDISGLSNLVSAGLKSMMIGSLFDSNKIKKTIQFFLKEQQTTINLYVPETLGDCVTTMDRCYNRKIKPYVDITKDAEWTALHIYQHKTGAQCGYPEEYKCVGTTESGKSREKTEGKKYSSTAYDNSFKMSNQMLEKTNGLKLLIHNSGGKKTNDEYNKTVIINKGTSDPFNDVDIHTIGDEYNFVYTNDETYLFT